MPSMDLNFLAINVPPVNSQSLQRQETRPLSPAELPCVFYYSTTFPLCKLELCYFLHKFFRPFLPGKRFCRTVRVLSPFLRQFCFLFSVLFLQSLGAGNRAAGGIFYSGFVLHFIMAKAGGASRSVRRLRTFEILLFCLLFSEAVRKFLCSPFLLRYFVV